MKQPVLEFRVALTASDYEMLTAFYQAGLGLEVAAEWTDNGRGVVYDMGRATLEILDQQHSAKVDEIETEGRVSSGQVRFALQVPDVDAAVKRLIEKGATLVHEPVVTPWGDYNARVQSPDGLQVTLFQIRDQQGE
jgi:catechol 2,3-dioxygenase-like lactoylglutathione lyase family enzyme